MDELYSIYNLMQFFGLNDRESFYQYYNTVLAPLENQNLDIEGFEWAPLQADFTYEMLESQDDFEVMATYTDLDSDALPTHGEVQYNKLTGTIPRHKTFATIDETDYRKRLVMLNNLASSAQLIGNNVSLTIREHLEEYLFEKLSSIPNKHKNTLNYQVGQALSKGGLLLDDNNNPSGLRGINFDFNIPSENRDAQIVLMYELNSGNVTSYVEDLNPIEVIQNEVRKIKHGQYAYDNICIEIDEQFWEDLMGHPAWAEAIGYSINPQLRIAPNNSTNAQAVGSSFLMTSSTDAKKELFRQICGVDEVHYRRAVVGVEHYVVPNNMFQKDKFKAFDYGVLTFRPTGTIGKIIPVAPMRPDASAITSTIYGGRGIIEYLYDARTRVQTWRSELTCLAVPTDPRRIHILTMGGGKR